MKYRVRHVDTSWLFFTPFSFLNMGGTDLYVLECKKHFMNIKEFKWKPITEIPTEHWANNYAISPLYLVKCGEKNGIAILGYSNYSFVTKSWIDCCHATEPGIHRVTEWTDIKL